MSQPSLEREVKLLIRRGFDGLYHPDPAMECGCFVDDLRPCGETRTGCRGGYANLEHTGVFRPVWRRLNKTVKS